MADLRVIYLARRASGMAAAQTFSESYRRHDSGVSHDLLIAYKGFPERRNAYRNLLDGLEYDEIEVPDRGYDIGSYIAASRQVEARYVCFLNSFSEILAPNWLATLFGHAVQPGVGVAGATGSWESFYTTYEIEGHRSQSGIQIQRWARGAWRGYKLDRLRRDYLPAPNPHLRSNAIVVDRTRWLSLSVGRLKSKEDLWRFESGRNNMTRQILSQGLDALVVGRDGIGYSKERWPHSATFRSGDQRNLLVADNRTRDYDQASPAGKERLAQLAWGTFSAAGVG